MPNRREKDSPGRAPLSPQSAGPGGPLPEMLAGPGWELPRTFLGLDEALSDFQGARAVVLPVPYESTTSFGGGTRNGPQAILDASRYIELFDQELLTEPSAVGIATLPALQLSQAGSEQALAELRVAYRRLLDAAPGKFVVMLGGEHSITGPAVLEWAARSGGRRLSVLQLDAHTDLRESYEGTVHSHASVMHRVRERVNLVAVGVRALTSEEWRLAEDSEHIHLFMADDVHSSDDWMERAVDLLTDDVYITLDVDCFDPSLVPSTGTPEPGGLTWYPVLKLLRKVFEKRNVVGCDVVELAPVPGLPAPDFTIAKLVYKLIGYRFCIPDN